MLWYGNVVDVCILIYFQVWVLIGHVEHTECGVHIPFFRIAITIEGGRTALACQNLITGEQVEFMVLA